MEDNLAEIMRSGFASVVTSIGETNKRIDETNKRIDETNKRVDGTNKSLNDFAKDTSTKLDGIGNYLRSINGSVADHAERIFKIEKRLDQIEKSTGT